MQITSRVQRFSTIVLLAAGIGSVAQAHFQELIPSTDILSAESASTLTLELRFTHPMEGGPLMPMAKPEQFGVQGPNGREDLSASLQQVEIDGVPTYRAAYQIKRPGDHQFFVEPAPYWEPAEGVMIQHHTKVVVDAYGGGGNWDQPLGLPVEIIPLTRPYGLWTGNLFRGLVVRDGQPVPFAEVEIEWRNDGSFQAPADAYITQVVKADAQGVFGYAIPRAGWWGFAALIEGDTPMHNSRGEAVPVELGALIWLRARDMH